MIGENVGAAEWTALGTGVRVVTVDPSSIDAATAAVEAVLEAVDRACSRFRSDSEITAFNTSAGRTVRVSALFARALAAALRAAEQSGGAVDPTIGSALRLVGYDRDFAEIPAAGAPLRLQAVPASGWRNLVLNIGLGTASMPRGTEIDLGATAKALAADLAADAALGAAPGGALVSLGGDIATRGPSPAGGWRIQVSEDSGAALSDEAESIAVTQAGIATSTTTIRRWRRGAVELHHIIDPGTGLPASGPWRTASVVAADCVDANTAATAAIVKGEGAVSWLLSTGLQARLVAHDGAVVRVGGWPAPREAGA